MCVDHWIEKKCGKQDVCKYLPFNIRATLSAVPTVFVAVHRYVPASLDWALRIVSDGSSGVEPLYLFNLLVIMSL